MVERRELITICRQIGTMMEVGVDFLRITRALRQQTENPRLLELYDQLDLDMKMGESLAEALSHAPDVFSPFAVSLIRQGEARGDIEGAFYRLADFLKQEAQEEKELGSEPGIIGTGYIPTGGVRSHGLEVVAPKAPITVGMVSDLLDRIQRVALRGMTWVSGFLLSLAAVWWAAELEFIEKRWLVGMLYCVAAIFIGGAGSWLRSRLEADRRRQPHCSFCGKPEAPTAPITRSARLAGAAICDSCARIISGSAGAAREQTSTDHFTSGDTGVSAAQSHNGEAHLKGDAREDPFAVEDTVPAAGATRGRD